MDQKEIAEIVCGAKELLLDRARAADVTVKGKQDFVTQVDIMVQRYLEEALRRRYPQVQFMGEESKKGEIDRKKPVWIVDPVDGTTNLIYDYQMSAVSVGLVIENEPILGVVYNPYTEELFTAQKGEGAFLNGKRIHVSEAKTVQESLIAFGTTPYHKEYAPAVFDLARRFFEQAKDVRRCGAASLDLCYVACGRNDAYFEGNLKPWDYAAGAVILQEAGGALCDWKGRAVRYYENCDILAVNGRLKEEMLSYFTEEITPLAQV